jgi:molecular chaperone IbpA
MRTYDFTPLLRASVGFDRFDRLFDSLGRQDAQAPAYPPYNIEKLATEGEGPDRYRITMAVAGFGEADIDVTQHENRLVISGKAGEAGETDEATSFLHRGIARRAFERRFELADYISVVAAGLDNGLLHVELEREVPEEKKPRRIAISRPAITKKAA